VQRPDFSNYVAHFTKDATPLGAAEHPDDKALQGIKGTAFERLISILEAEKIFATPMPWTNRYAVAFTECPWGSLLDHTKRYSPYGLGFRKDHLFEVGGGPAIYLRPDLHAAQKDFQSQLRPQWKGFHPGLYAFVTPFCPGYAPKSYKSKYWPGKPVDYSHEREWRVPQDYKFDLSQVEFVVVPNYEAVATFPKTLKDQIGREKFIIVEVYSQIEKLWPVHIL
jgi:hypothetical protein